MFVETLCDLIDTYPVNSLKNDLLMDYSKKMNNWLSKIKYK